MTAAAGSAAQGSPEDEAGWTLPGALDQEDEERTRIVLAEPGPEPEAPGTSLQADAAAEDDEPTAIVKAPLNDEPGQAGIEGGGIDPEDPTTILVGDAAPDDDESTAIVQAAAIVQASDAGKEADPAASAGFVPPEAPPGSGGNMSAAFDGVDTTDVTELVPALLPAGADDGSWFEGLLGAFIGGLRQDEHGRLRSADEFRTLAAAARDTIARVATQGMPAADWAADTVLQPEQVLANTYVVRALIARGGVGEIYRTRHRDLRTEQAIKILLPRYALDSTMLTLMLEEARLLQCVRHEAVVGCQDLLRDTDGRPMLVMDYLRGRTLSMRLREGRLSDADLFALALRLARGLAAIHAAGIVHQDISPDNIILVEDSCAAATIIDFGLARRHSDQRDVHRQLDFAGKFSWASPEQLAGRPAVVDSRSDLYSLGLMLAAAARGCRLEMGHDLESSRVARRTMPMLAGIDQPMAGLLERLLAPVADDRLASADEIPSVLSPRRPGLFKRLIGRTAAA